MYIPTLVTAARFEGYSMTIFELMLLHFVECGGRSMKGRSGKGREEGVHVYLDLP